MAFFDALNSVTQEKKDEVPNHLADASRDSEGLGHGKGYLYPHAYRDHWVAQQYLPDGLQGKMFYEPSDQGYEKGIKATVARHRETQIEAIAEASERSVLDTTHEGGPGDAGMWLERSSGVSGGQLDRIRQRVFELAGLQPGDIVLDLYARTGLLTFEAARLAAEGAVWSLAHDGKSFETLCALARNYEELRRPQIVASSYASFEADLVEAAGGRVLFDCIVGRNALGLESDKVDLVHRCLALLADGGRMVLAETVHSAGQRITELISRLSPKQAEKVCLAEESLFADPADPLVNWTAQGLLAKLQQDQKLTVRSTTLTLQTPRRLPPAEIDRWFRETAGQGRKSLGERLTEVSGAAAAAEIRAALHADLDNREVVWKAAVAFFEIARRS
jgi:putative ATPase